VNTSLVQMLTKARAAGFALTKNPDGTLTVRGSKSEAALVRVLLARKLEVLTFVDLYNGRITLLDWRHATVGEHPARCVLCRRPALLRDPFDGLPMHKTCVERALTPQRPSAEGSSS
jgi:hypothetical protein